MSSEFAPRDEAAARVNERDIARMLDEYGSWPFNLVVAAGSHGRHHYPSIEVVETDTSQTRDPAVLTYQTMFEITVYQRINTTPRTRAARSTA